jgi:hypothetical protein
MLDTIRDAFETESRSLSTAARNSGNIIVLRATVMVMLATDSVSLIRFSIFIWAKPPRKKHEDVYHGFFKDDFSESREASVIAQQTHKDGAGDAFLLL